jgi:hypothetical protein
MNSPEDILTRILQIADLQSVKLAKKAKQKPLTLQEVQSLGIYARILQDCTKSDSADLRKISQLSDSDLETQALEELERVLTNKRAVKTRSSSKPKKVNSSEQH